MASTQERISKIVSACGVCSRRSAEDLLRAGRITVNGVPAVLGQKADAETDRIEVDGRPLQQQGRMVYLMLHKPRGYVTTVSDERGRTTVMDLIRDVPERVWPVGRLDMDSEGLLLLTNDGALTNHLLHPSGEVDKIYHVRVRGDVAPAVGKLRAMDRLDGEPIRRPGVRVLARNEADALLAITIHEGKNRQIRRMCVAAGLSVLRLKRVREGTLSLGSLPSGTWRFLTEAEVLLLKKA